MPRDANTYLSRLRKVFKPHQSLPSTEGIAPEAAAYSPSNSKEHGAEVNSGTVLWQFVRHLNGLTRLQVAHI